MREWRLDMGFVATGRRGCVGFSSGLVIWGWERVKVSGKW